MGLRMITPKYGWDLRNCLYSEGGECAFLLKVGWEPFAVTHGVIWFRRKREIVEDDS